jgi:hypothetical protein
MFAVGSIACRLPDMYVKPENINRLDVKTPGSAKPRNTSKIFWIGGVIWSD